MLIHNCKLCYCCTFLDACLPDHSISSHIIFLEVDNTLDKCGLNKTCQSSIAGNVLECLLCALMMNKPVCMNSAHRCTIKNEIDDRISYFKNKLRLCMIFVSSTGFLLLTICWHFHPSPNSSLQLWMYCCLGSIYNNTKVSLFHTSTP